MEGVTASRSVILAPGGNSSADSPLLMYARRAAERRGAQVRALSWQLPGDLDYHQLRERVSARASAAVAELAEADGVAPVLIGKSLGSLAAGVAADRGLTAVWFTPLLINEPTVAALRRATAPRLLIGGTADRLWDGRLARELSADVVEIDGADHGLFVPGRLAASAAVLGQVATAVEDFLDQAWRAS